MSTQGERKCALLLLTLRASDRRRMLARLPKESARTIRSLIVRLEALPLPMAALAQELLADEVLGLTAEHSIALDELVSLAGRLPPAWFARVLSAWSGVNQTFCLSLLDAEVATQVREELARLQSLPPRLADALKAEAMAMTAALPEAA